MEEFTYSITCDICETSMTLKVMDVDELPNFCPMCGDEVDAVQYIDD